MNKQMNQPNPFDLSLGQPLESGSQKYPAIQATDYQPRMGDAVQLCLSDSSVSLLAPAWKDFFSQFSREVYYGNDQETVYALPANTQFLFLGIPRTFAQDKDDKTIRRLQRGVKLSQMGVSGSVTATRCLVLIAIDGQFVVSDDGSYQFFTLKLTSTKTKLLNDSRDPEYRSLAKLNRTLIEHYKLPRQSWTHLVTIGLKATPTVFNQANSNQSSVGIMFEFEGKPTPLDKSLQQSISLVSTSEEVKTFLQDPFNLDQKQEEQAPYAEYANSVQQDKEDLGLAGVPF